MLRLEGFGGNPRPLLILEGTRFNLSSQFKIMKQRYLLVFLSILFLVVNMSCAQQPETIAPNSNAIHMISPYLYQGEWVFDDVRAGLVKEPFVEGIPEMIDELVADIPDAKDGFILYFSDQPMPETGVVLTWKRKEYDGNWYWAEAYQKEGWLCPALFHYYDEAPQNIYVKAKSKNKR